MIKLLVIADDFTGALDTGVQFSKQGISTLVSTNTEINTNEVDEDIEVLVIDTESRYLSNDEAYKIIHDLIVSAKKMKIPFIYKKVDSALRGNISAEIKAVLDASQTTAIPFLPAYPEMNRVLINGDLYIDQVLVSQSVFAKDPYEPVIESNVLRRLKKEANIEGQLIKNQLLPDILKGVLVFDAERDEDLEKQATLLEKANLLSISIGCAGFAKVLATKLFSKVESHEYSLKKPLVVICGSVNPVTRKQVDYIEKKNYPRISLRPHQLLQQNYWSKEGKKEIADYLSLLEDQSLILFETLSEETSRGIELVSNEQGQDVTDFRFRIGQALGELTQALWSEHTENTFLFTGGDTLFQSMNVLGINQIKPIAEISPGVVLSTIIWQEKENQVITKSGGFGNEALFEEICHLTE
ncbi:four-carbon acid sugar kinase family protein [Enterococcus sp. DIV0170]|uniref:four-carbon acid sugar kinase family protein n=1 Tax=Enterococcus sp. DIV0170 TaxID=2774642 RepID=UPI003F2366EB